MYGGFSEGGKHSITQRATMKKRSVQYGLITMISLVLVGLSMILAVQRRPSLAQNATAEPTMAATCGCRPPDFTKDMASLKLEPITAENASRITLLARVN